MLKEMVKQTDIVGYLYDNQKIDASQPFIKDTHFQVITGSHSCGYANDDSDLDVVAFCTPPKEMVFPALGGYIDGFGDQPPRFKSYQAQGIKIDHEDVTIDLKVYNITSFFDMCIRGNPNILQALFVDPIFVMHIDEVGKSIYKNKSLFLSKQCYKTFTGFAKSQFMKLCNQKKDDSVHQIYGFDPKVAVTAIRALLECTMLLKECDIYQQRYKDIYKAIRNGFFSFDNIKDLFYEKLKLATDLVSTSTLPEEPDVEVIRSILLDCLKHKYGTLNFLINIGGN